MCVCVRYVSVFVCFSGAEGCGRMLRFMEKRIRLYVQCMEIIKLELMILPDEYVNNSGLFFRDVTLLCLCIFYIILRVCDKN